MRLTSKIRGYTLAELMVALLISAMVIAYSTGTGLFLSSRYSSSSDNIFSTIEFIGFKSDIERSVFKAESIFTSDSTIFFHMPNKQVVEYKFDEGYILRSFENIRDTFHFTPYGLELTYKTNTQLVESIKLTLIMHNQSTFYFAKKYPVNVIVDQFIDW